MIHDMKYDTYQNPKLWKKGTRNAASASMSYLLV